MNTTTQTLTRSEMAERMVEDKVNRVLLIDGKTKLDRGAIRSFVKTKGIDLLSPRVGYVVFKLTGNIEPDDGE